MLAHNNQKMFLESLLLHLGIMKKKCFSHNIIDYINWYKYLLNILSDR